MVVCKFFLQGECRFGENCRFEHILGSEKSGNQPFGNNESPKKIFNPKTGTEIDIITLINSVQNDAISGEKGRQWLLTCYAPFKEKPLYPGFVDMSFEEVRFGYIEAQKSNNLEQYNQGLQQLLMEAQARYKALQNPTKEIVQMLRNIYNNEVNSSSGSNQNLISQTTTGFASVTTRTRSIFCQSSQGKNSPFGQTSQSIFGQQNSLGGSASIFGLQNAQNSSGSIFGQQNTAPSSIFGQQGFPQNTGSILVQQQSIFRQMSANQKESSVFVQQQKSIFGGSGNVLNQQQNGGKNFGQQSGSIFGQQSAPQSSTSIFANTSQGTGTMFGQQNNTPNTGNVFGQPSNFQNSSNIFTDQNNAQGSTNIFGQQKSPQNTVSIFGQQNNPQDSNNIFGQQNNTQQTSNNFGQQNPVQSGASIFGQNNMTQNSNSSTFGLPQSGIFGNTQQQLNQNTVPQDSNQQQQSIFARMSEPKISTSQPPNTLFPATNSNTNPPQSASIFGMAPATAAPTTSVYQGSSNTEINPDAYSKLEDLTEEEIKWFNSDVFDIYKIPEKPPTYEMCS